MLAAQAVIDAPENFDSVRFATPSLLSLKDDLGNYSEVPIGIGGKQGAEMSGLGAVTALPSLWTVQLNGAAMQGNVVDWGCSMPHGHAEHKGRRYSEVGSGP